MEQAIDEARTGVRIRRAASIVLGAGLQVLMGMLLWLAPPGGLGALLLYLGLGLLGFIHLLMGVTGWRPLAAGLDMHHPAHAVLTEFEPDGIPWSAQRCPGCDENIAEPIARGRRACPACGAAFSLRDLGWRQWDPAGEPASLRPGEVRIQGGGFMALFAAGLILAAMAVVVAISP